MFLVNLLLGIALLIWGRKLFWLFIAAAGFVTGMQFAARSLHGPEWLGIVIGLVVGLIAALLAVFLKTLAIGLAGFLAGGSVLLGLAGLFGLDTGILSWVIYLIGGIGGVLIVSAFFDWALVILSSLGGASLVTGALDAGRIPGWMLFLALTVIGIAVQASQMKKDKKD
ncbi:MAG: hypothetical protein AB1564_13975 [Chloroflexota bacterium]